MEANLGGKSYNSYSSVVPNMKALGKRSMEWDLNDWEWNGDLFTATPLNPMPSDCYGKKLFTIEENGNNLQKRDLEKRRRDVVVIEEKELGNNNNNNEADGSLNLKLGGQVYPITEADMEKLEGKIGKKSKTVEVVSTSNRAVCQVEDCRADLSCAKDYHRRHKVCEVHSKATRALVANVMQRFCQQCSRFHVLEEFDEGKRSCRRRLAGHNRRRRKTHPENMVNAGPLADEQSSSYLLVSLLRILANMQSNSSNQSEGKDFISHLLKNLAGLNNARNISAPLDNTQDLCNAGTSNGTTEKESLKPNLQHTSGKMRRNEIDLNNVNNIDLNTAYDDSQDCEEILNNSPVPPNFGINSPDCSLMGYQSRQKSSIPQNSGTSGSLSTLSPSSSSGEPQSRTDRIVFKLFGKDPSDFPPVLRKQIFDWLSDTPTDIESYIRPGCIILTIYLRLKKSTWEEIFHDLSSSLTKHLESSNDSFWKMGWVYTRVLNHIAFIHNGRIVLDTMLPLGSHKNCSILSIKPIAASVSKITQFSVKGINLSQSATRVLCALEGNYLDQETCSESGGESNTSVANTEIQCLRFSCSIPNVIGRGFIEVEDQSLNSSFFPFIVAEQDVCTEICTLESTIEVAENPNYQILESGKIKARDDALQFIHEMGWLLHRTRLKFKLIPIETNLGLFSFERFSWLMEYSIEHDWCAVVKKLLEISFSGTVNSGNYRNNELALLDMGLVHRAVRRNCGSMVKTLLNYVPNGVSDKLNSENIKFLFRPDASGPGGLTPLHIAASKEGSEYVLDALTDDPGLVGIEAWKSARDNTGMTPNDYASMRGYYIYNNIVQKKINQISSSTKGHVVLDIDKPTRFTSSFNTEKKEIKPNYQLNCKICEQKMAYGSSRTSLYIYRPAMLSMLAIAAVCICAALLFKTSPRVAYVFEPFRWEHLKYGPI